MPKGKFNEKIYVVYIFHKIFSNILNSLLFKYPRINTQINVYYA